jgi:hypothetical protein
MRQDERKLEALQYQGKGKAYIHTEVINENAEILMCGDLVSILYGFLCQIRRFGELRNLSDRDVIGLIYELKAIGYENICEKTVNKKINYIKGDDWQEEWKKEQIKNLTKKEKQLAKEVTKLQQENEKLKNLNHEIKKNYANQLNFKNEQIQRLRTQILRLEHEIKALENAEMEEGKQCIK